METQALYDLAPIARIMFLGVVIALGPLAWVWADFDVVLALGLDAALVAMRTPYFWVGSAKPHFNRCRSDCQGF